MKSSVLLLGALPILASALTNLDGCTRTSILSLGTTFWWNPSLGEQCKFIDCGGGRAPPKTTVPGCGGYEGTDTVPVIGWPEETGGAGASRTTNSVESTTSVESPTPTVHPDQIPEGDAEALEADRLSSEIESRKSVWSRSSASENVEVITIPPKTGVSETGSSLPEETGGPNSSGVRVGRSVFLMAAGSAAMGVVVLLL